MKWNEPLQHELTDMQRFIQSIELMIYWAVTAFGTFVDYLNLTAKIDKLLPHKYRYNNRVAPENAGIKPWKADWTITWN